MSVKSAFVSAEYMAALLTRAVWDEASSIAAEIRFRNDLLSTFAFPADSCEDGPVPMQTVVVVLCNLEQRGRGVDIKAMAL